MLREKAREKLRGLIAACSASRSTVTGFEAHSLPHWKAKGYFTEIIQYQTRLFVPVSRAVEIVEALAA